MGKIKRFRNRARKVVPSGMIVVLLVMSLISVAFVPAPVSGSSHCFPSGEKFLTGTTGISLSDIRCDNTHTYSGDTSILIPSLDDNGNTNGDNWAGHTLNTDKDKNQYKFSTNFYYSGNSNLWIAVIFNYVDSNNFQAAGIRSDNGFQVWDVSGGSGDIVADRNAYGAAPENSWLNATIVVDNNANTVDYTLRKLSDGSVVWDYSNLNTGGSKTTNTVGVGVGASGTSGSDVWFDSNALLTKYGIYGSVTDSDGKPISSATVEVLDSSGSVLTTTTTDNVGSYSVSQTDGNYTVRVSKEGYITESKDVNLNGSSTVKDFSLQSKDGKLNLDVRPFLFHGSSDEYRVIVENKSGRYNVTGGSTVSVSDSTVLSVDQSNFEVTATNNTSVNRKVVVTANYTDSKGEFYTTQKEVTVANQSVENLDILPTWNKIGASLGSSSGGGVYQPSGTDLTLRVILVAVMLGAATALVSRVFAGIAALTLVMVLGWVAGWVGNGMVIVSFMTAMFIGLNIAANIDYSVRA